MPEHDHEHGHGEAPQPRNGQRPINWNIVAIGVVIVGQIVLTLTTFRTDARVAVFEAFMTARLEMPQRMTAAEANIEWLILACGGNATNDN